MSILENISHALKASYANSRFGHKRHASIIMKPKKKIDAYHSKYLPKGTVGVRKGLESPSSN